MSNVSTGARIYRRGFTLIELLVVVAIIASLIAILIPTLGRAQRLAKRTICAANLKGQGNSFAVLTAQNSDVLPNSPADMGGNWLHDVPNNTCNQLVNTTLGTSSTETAASVRKWFYCPTNFDANQDIAWDGSGTFRWLDYAYLNARGAGVTLPVGAFSTKNGRQSGKSPKLTYRTKMISTFQASDAELVVDELITSSAVSADWSVPNSVSNFHEYSSHLNGKTPDGQNVLCCDGHVSFRTFPGSSSLNMTPIQQQGAAAYFWVIDP